MEAEKPFMQAYKSLMLWKEVSGEQFDIRQLIQAFEENDHGDLARMTRNILDSTSHSDTGAIVLLLCCYCIAIVLLLY